MIGERDIPYLLSLLDDDSKIVKTEVTQALMSAGTRLEGMLRPFRMGLEPHRQQILDTICLKLRRRTFEKEWWEWINISASEQALEYALDRLAYLEHGTGHPHLGELLDQLEEQFYAKAYHLGIPQLLKFVFIDLGLSPPEEDYYDPRNSNLVYVIQHKSGIPISLSCIAILLAQRLKLNLYGWNLPGHFMLMSETENSIRIYDPFNKGKTIPPKTYHYLKRSLTLKKIPMAALKATKEDIILRVLRNLINAYARKGDKDSEKFYKEVLNELIERIRNFE